MHGDNQVRNRVLAFVGILASLLCPQGGWSDQTGMQEGRAKLIQLPPPRTDSDTSVEQALKARRSIRDYSRKKIKLEEIAQLLWAAQGITDREGMRTAPSAGATYPLEVYLVASRVEGLSEGIYKYRPASHDLLRVAEGSFRRELAGAALGQRVVSNGAAVIVLAAIYERTTRKYGRRGDRYVHMEAGHAAENVYLQAVSLNIGTVVVGAFDDGRVKRILQMKTDEEPLCLMPVGPR